MEPVSAALHRLKRQAETGRRQATFGLSILEEWESNAIGARLQDFPARLRAIAELTGARRQSREQLRLEDAECWAALG